MSLRHLPKPTGRPWTDEQADKASVRFKEVYDVDLLGRQLINVDFDKSDRCQEPVDQLTEGQGGGIMPWFLTVSPHEIKHDPDDANCVTSVLRSGGGHVPVINFDYDSEPENEMKRALSAALQGEATWIKATKGWHVYGNETMTWDYVVRNVQGLMHQYRDYIGGAWFDTARVRGFTTVRLPWEKKPAVTYSNDYFAGSTITTGPGTAIKQMTLKDMEELSESLRNTARPNVWPDKEEWDGAVKEARAAALNAQYSSYRIKSGTISAKDISV